MKKVLGGIGNFFKSKSTDEESHATMSSARETDIMSAASQSLDESL